MDFSPIHYTYGMNTDKVLVYNLYEDRAFYTVSFPIPLDRRNGTVDVALLLSGARHLAIGFTAKYGSGVHLPK
jgi:hypothetical protein